MSTEKLRGYWASVATVLVMTGLVGCKSEEHKRPTWAEQHVTEFCDAIAVELEAWAFQYHHVNEMSAGPDRTEYESHLSFRPSIYARGGVVHRIQSELSLCLSIRKIDPAEVGAHMDEVFHAVMRLLDGDDTVTIQKSLEALVPVVKKLNELPFDDRDF